MAKKEWNVIHPEGALRVIVTKNLPGQQWIDILAGMGCRVEVCASTDTLTVEEIAEAIGDQCDGAIGQLTEDWGAFLFSRLKAAGGRAYSNYAVGFNNIDIAAATRCGIAVGNTPGVLTETTAELAVALTFATARRFTEAEGFLRAGKFQGLLPDLFLGELLWRKTLGVIGAGRIGGAYARMMAQGHNMDVVYFNRSRNEVLEADIAAFGAFLESRGEAPVTCSKADSIEALLKVSDVVSIHTVLDEGTKGMVNATRLALMKENAILVNTSRGPVVDEAALVAHLKTRPDFRAGLDVYENEPAFTPGLADLPNAVLLPHIGSATRWTREGMATLAALNVAGVLKDLPAWNRADVRPFLEPEPPQAAPSILNAGELEVPLFRG